MNISLPTIRLAQYFRQIAIEELMPRHLNPNEGKVSRHSDGSFVTEADLASEARLIEAAQITHPHALATGEEEIAEDPNAFLEMAKDKDVWIFDPLDGTAAFREGRDVYGIVGAYIQSGQTTAGIIYVPGFANKNADGSLTPQKDITIMAERGQGCWMYTGTEPDEAKQIHIGNRAHFLRGKTLTSSARVAFACRNQDEKYQELLVAGVAAVLPRWHAHHDYLCVLMGDLDAVFYAEGFMPNGVGKCPPWDHAAGVLAVQEAGGYAALPYGEVGKGGQAYGPLKCDSSLLVAANRKLFDDMMKHVATNAHELLMPR
jgi:fructose-1,6-bisphosphatase/inositol monophosphatase family enzyme